MINTVRLRNSLGILGMLLPWLVFGLSFVAPEYTGYVGHLIPVDSISATYYISTCMSPFMIILGAAGLLLISYRGYDRQDDIICTLAGIFGLMICIFPCDMAGALVDVRVGMFALTSHVSGIIHNLSAVAFFLLLAYNSLFLFTKSSGEMTEKKRKRNIIFRVCGVGMVLSLAAIFVARFYGGTWLVEMFALTFFGVSWLTKSNSIPFLFAEK